MRKIIVSNLVSLDGYFEGPNKELDWFVVDEEFNKYAINLLNEVDTILFGRVTYEFMETYWPTESAIKNDPAVSSKMNGLSKIIFSKTLSAVTWNNSTLINEIIPGEIKKLKEAEGKDMVIFGSGMLISNLAKLRLIDEYRLIVNPVILGKGNSLFRGLDKKLNLKLINTKTLGSGVVILSYETK